MSSEGGVPERPNGTVSKTVVEETPPRVRIPAPPPICNICTDNLRFLRPQYENLRRLTVSLLNQDSPLCRCTNKK
jgi:hypothetical protein